MPNLSVKNFLLLNQILEKDAIISSGKNLSYAELAQKVSDKKKSLESLGIKENDSVAVPGYQNEEFIVHTIALWQIGAVVVPYNPKFTEAELQKLFKLSECSFILADEELEIKFKYTSATVLQYPTTAKPNLTNIEDISTPEFTKTAAIIFTSGTSTEPKAVELSFKSFFESAKIGNKILEHKSDDKWLASLPFFHVSGFSILTRALLYNTSIVLPDSLKEIYLKNSIEQFNPTLCSLVPTQLKRLLQFEIKNIESIRHVLIGGGFSDAKLITQAIQSGWNITKVYGSTETCAFVCAIGSDELLAKPGSSGKGLLPNQIKVMSDKHIFLSECNVGEIVIDTPAIMKGYFNNPQEIKKKFYNEFYLTGDLGYIDDEGDLFLEIRRTDLIITGGENVNPLQVESELLNHPEILDAAVIPLPDDEWGQIVAAVIVPRSNTAELSLNEIQNFLRIEIADYKLPRKVFFLESLPINELGKLNRQKLIDLFSEED